MTETPRGWGVTPSTGIPTIAFGNQKAGQEKQRRRSTVPAALATRNHDVLAIDMDPQADMTKGLGLGPGDDNDPSSPKNELPNTLVTDDENLLDVLSIIPARTILVFQRL